MSVSPYLTERDKTEESKEIHLHFPQCISHSFLLTFVSVDHTFNSDFGMDFGTVKLEK